MKRIKFLAILMALITCGVMRAELVMQFDFSKVTSKNVKDDISGITATLMGAATVQTMGEYKVMNLGAANGYLDMKAAAGTLFAGLTKYSISCYYRVDNTADITKAGNFLWSFCTVESAGSGGGNYSAYRINAQRIANSTGGFTNEKGIEVGEKSLQGSWQHVLYIQSGTTGKLYINGVLVGSGTMPTNKELFDATKPAYCWIGRPPFGSDAYLSNTLVTRFEVYNHVLANSEIKALAAETDKMDYAYRYGTPGNFSTLQTAVNQAKTFVAGLSPDVYPASAIAEYQDIIDYCQVLINEGKISQTIINEYKTALTSAKSKLTAAKNKKFVTTDVTFGYDRERGFIHPGGLHTEADFDRIKQQLASGNAKVKQAMNVLRSAGYAQSTAGTNPVETIVRGGGVGENYMNAARGAAIAYQNALRWKIDGDKACAKHAIDVLMQWARTTKNITGDSNYALASGLYGYQFAQAGELMHGYEGWSEGDFQTFRRWMLNVWYPKAIGFLRARNGSWENSGRWWQAPGHYWSNWSLANALCVITIGVLCDDVHIYNQGMSFLKYDQVGTFKDPRTGDEILTDGLTDFWGNLIVTTSEWEKETGAYGKVGQMNESGRDAGHCAMALGLAADVAHQAYNQGDDMFAYMDHRLAAGIEFVAAQSQNEEGLPWTNYHYYTGGFAYTDSRSTLMTEPAMGVHIRPYWGTIIGHYEGVKGVKMPFAEKAYEQMGIDGGGAGATSGGYDHLGYSVLLNTRDGIAAPEAVPTELSGHITYNGKTVKQSDLGALKNTYKDDKDYGITAGTILTLKPQLPDGEADTGKWLWESGETTRDITVTANRSNIYRVTYTNQNGVESQQCFAICVAGDCEEDGVEATYTTVDDIVTQYVNSGANIDVIVSYGSSLKLSLSSIAGWNSTEWDNGQTTTEILLPCVTSPRAVQGIYTSQGGRKTLVTFNIKVNQIRQNITVGTKLYKDAASAVITTGAKVILSPEPAQSRDYGTWVWDDGSTERELTLENVTESVRRTVSYVIDGVSSTYAFDIYVKEAVDRKLADGDYCIVHRPTGLYLTNEDGMACLQPREAKTADEGLSGNPEDIVNTSPKQVWTITRSTSTYNFMSLKDNSYMKSDLYMTDEQPSAPHRITWAAGTNYAAIYYSASKYYWTVDANGAIRGGADGSTTLSEYPFEFIAANGETGICTLPADNGTTNSNILYDLSGRRVEGRAPAGIYIRNGKKVVVR